LFVSVTPPCMVMTTGADTSVGLACAGASKLGVRKERLTMDPITQRPRGIALSPRTVMVGW
jgi:hypothetical protein